MPLHQLPSVSQNKYNSSATVHYAIQSTHAIFIINYYSHLNYDLQVLKKPLSATASKNSLPCKISTNSQFFSATVHFAFHEIIAIATRQDIQATYANTSNTFQVTWQLSLLRYSKYNCSIYMCVCVCMCKLCKYSKTENYQSNENCTDLTDKQKQLLTDIQVTMYEPSP
jgi:hypothetical protein